jgi:hypothetical protein
MISAISVTFSSLISDPACSAAILIRLAVVSQFLQPGPSTLIVFMVFPVSGREQMQMPVSAFIQDKYIEFIRITRVRRIIAKDLLYTWWVSFRAP